MPNSYYYMNDSTIKENGADIYESKLTLKYLNQRYVGFYSCVKSKSADVVDVDQLEQANEATKFYLFVDGNSLVYFFRISIIALTLISSMYRSK